MRGTNKESGKKNNEIEPNKSPEGSEEIPQSTQTGLRKKIKGRTTGEGMDEGLIDTVLVFYSLI